ncbi:MucBP domain-containing protein [Lactovum odontotermitis]
MHKTVKGMLAASSIILMTAGVFVITVPASANTVPDSGELSVLADSATLDSWMPDKDVQAFVAGYLGIDKSEITKELLAQTHLPIDYSSNRNFFEFSSYAGLEYFSRIDIYVHSDTYDGSSAYLHEHPIDWNTLLQLKNVNVSASGDLTEVFPGGINLDDKRITVDPHNIYFMHDVHLNQNNYESFYLSWSELKLWVADPSVLPTRFVSFNGTSYSARPEENGIRFTLSDSIAYSELAGKSFVNASRSVSFPEGPYLQTTNGYGYINTRINLYFSMPGGDITVKYIDRDGAEISPSRTLSGGAGEDYSAELLDISGYTFSEAVGSPTGQFTEEPQTISYIYTKDSNEVVKPDPEPTPVPESDPQPKPTPVPESEPQPKPTPEPGDVKETPAPVKVSTPNLNLSTVSAAKTGVKTVNASVLPSTADEDESRAPVFVAGGLAVLGAAFLGVVTRLKGRKS